MEKFNKLTIIKEIEPHIRKSGKKIRKVLCKCECGNEKEFILDSLKNGNTKSCGCLRNQKSSLRLKNNKLKQTHGLSKHSLYQTWKDIKKRCLNTTYEKYPNWGGRGIKICERWLGENGFINFINDMGPKPDKNYSIDRIDNDGHYEPSNCRWATQKEQVNNTRRKKLN